MSEYVVRLPKDPTGTAAGSPSQDFSNAGSGFLNQSLTVNNSLIIAQAAISGKQIISTIYGAAVDQLGNSEFEENLSKVQKGIGYGLIAYVSPIVAVGKGIVDASSRGIERALYIQNTNLENAYKESIRGVNTSLGGYYD